MQLFIKTAGSNSSAYMLDKFNSSISVNHSFFSSFVTDFEYLIIKFIESSPDLVVSKYNFTT